ncbi:GNAT family N-acetyltransferase [Desulfosporosinus sp. PR]|uniref:GNAT family N-acetyltransferase n=1 Tax=Candidatus Desulfosporosinus nitrosoreducens TaxID=3401928 RepID=UPI0027FD9FF3|nr:GNAT family N-acetyltransferase [Desulfosporosinus sp. PR]MDQ7094805.1 GNAT family N-acetyltransferase [Desulfosporosinus sp. PR]
MITVQSATVSDLEPLAQLYEELSGQKTNSYRMQENFKLMGLNQDYVIKIAKDGDLVVGTVMGIICLDLVGKCKPFMVIENVIVKRTWHGRGIGKILMKEIEEVGRKRGCYYTMFVSAGHRKEAHKFYEAIGYELDFVQGFKKYL